MALPEFLSPAEVEMNNRWARKIARDIDAKKSNQCRFPTALAFWSDRYGFDDAVKMAQYWAIGKIGQAEARAYCKRVIPPTMVRDYPQEAIPHVRRRAMTDQDMELEYLDRQERRHRYR